MKVSLDHSLMVLGRTAIAALQVCLVRVSFSSSVMMFTVSVYSQINVGINASSYDISETIHHIGEAL